MVLLGAVKRRKILKRNELIIEETYGTDYYIVCRDELTLVDIARDLTRHIMYQKVLSLFLFSLLGSWIAKYTNL